jgi:hypothetical protein
MEHEDMDHEDMNHTKSEEPELSYEDEQIQMLIQKHLDQEKAQKERDIKRAEANAQREFIRQQNEEYQASVLRDLDTSQEKSQEKDGQKDSDTKPTFEEPSVEEMRRVRLQRFQ